MECSPDQVKRVPVVAAAAAVVVGACLSCCHRYVGNIRLLAFMLVQLEAIFELPSFFFFIYYDCLSLTIVVSN